MKAKIRSNVSRIRGVIMVAVDDDREYPKDSLGTLQKGSLVEFHQRLGHLNYNAVEV